MAHRRSTVNITVRYAETAVYEGKGRSKDIRWDRQVPSLGLRVQPSGAKTWTLEYRNPKTNQRRFLSLGHFPEVGPEMARTAARDALHQIHVEKEDPILEAERRATDPEHLTWDQLLDRAEPEYLKPMASYPSRTHHVRWLRRHWGKRALSAVSMVETEEAWVEIATKSGPSAARSWDAIRRGILYWGLRRARPRAIIAAAWQVPLVSRDLLIEHPRKCGPRGRTEYIPTHRIGQVWEELGDLPWRQQGVLKLMILTGHRAHTIRHWCRSNFFDVQQTIIARVHKTVRIAGDLEIVLSSEALDVVRGLPPIIGCDLLFPADDKRGGYRADQPISHQAVWQKWDLVRRKLDLRGHDGEFLKPHDLRHTVGTYLAARGYTAETIAGVLGKQGTDTVRDYIHTMDETRRAALAEVAKMVIGE